MDIKPSKDFLEWFQEKIKGMSAQEYKDYVMGNKFPIEPTEHHREMIDKLAAGKMPSGWYTGTGLYDYVPFDKEADDYIKRKMIK